MFLERRKHPRQQIDRRAEMRTDAGYLVGTSLLTDISETGARLYVDPSAEVPDTFTLCVGGDKTTRRDCRVIWRLGGEIGVAFLAQKPDQQRQRAIEEFQSHAREVFQKAG